METPMSHRVETFSIVQKGYIVQSETIIVQNNQQWGSSLYFPQALLRSNVNTYVLFYVFTLTLKVQ